MTTGELFQLIIYFGVLIVSAKLLGEFMARVYTDQKVWLSPVIRPIESVIYRLARPSTTYPFLF